MSSTVGRHKIASAGGNQHSYRSHQPPGAPFASMRRGEPGGTRVSRHRASTSSKLGAVNAKAVSGQVGIRHPSGTRAL
jgi:hypothetical protein